MREGEGEAKKLDCSRKMRVYVNEKSDLRESFSLLIILLSLRKVELTICVVSKLILRKLSIESGQP